MHCSSSAPRRRARPWTRCAPPSLAKDGIRRIGKPEDIAALTLFLCSEKARHIQGTAIAVDGGATPRGVLGHRRLNCCMAARDLCTAPRIV